MSEEAKSKTLLEIRNQMRKMGGRCVRADAKHLGKIPYCVISEQNQIEISLNMRSKWFYIFSHDSSESKDDIPSKLVGLSGLREIDGLRFERVQKLYDLLDDKTTGEYGVICKYHLPNDFEFENMTDVQWRRLFGWYVQIEVELLQLGVYSVDKGM